MKKCKGIVKAVIGVGIGSFIASIFCGIRNRRDNLFSRKNARRFFRNIRNIINTN